MDAEILFAHEELRSLMLPLIREKIGNVAWNKTPEGELFHSPEYFAKQYSTPAMRTSIIAAWRGKLNVETLTGDHDALRAVMYPDMQSFLTWSPAVLRESEDYQLYSDKHYFHRHFPTHQERLEFIDLTRKNWEEQQAKLKKHFRVARRVIRETLDHKLPTLDKTSGDHSPDFPNPSPSR